MPDRPLHGVIQYLRGIAARGDAAHVSDDQLLERFVSQRDEAAFELLVWRHGKMVLGVCRRLLHDTHAAEDAFQASFLMLARRASAIHKRSSVGGWLYKVAYRVALQARAQTLKRTSREAPFQEISKVAAIGDAHEEAERRELRFVIDDEVNRLPEKYRVPFVLCYFQGRSNAEAARELGCALGTVESRLTRARQRLRTRLSHRGFWVSGGLSAAVFSEGVASAWVPTPLVIHTAKVAAQAATGPVAGAVSAHVAALTEGVLRAMFMTKLRIIAAVLGISLLGSGAGLFTHRAWGDKPSDVAQDSSKQSTADPKEAQPPVPPAPAAADGLKPAPGYAWAIAPRDGRGVGWAIGWRRPPQPGLPADAGISAIEETGKDGGLVIILAHPPSNSQTSLPDYRPVAFDAARKRYPLKMDTSVGTATATLARYTLDPKILAAEKVTHLGIEVLTPEGAKIIAKQAAKQAQQTKIGVPSFPEVGKAYDFELTTTEGKKIRARDLRGKVILIDCWATWCGPCMSLLPDIKEQYEKWHQDGLEVIAINFDHDVEKVKKTCRLLGLSWPQVIVPNDEATRQFWREASGIGALPRVLLIDREGILRADQAHQLDKEIAKLLKNSWE